MEQEKNKKSRIKAKAGTTMIEVLVAFVVVMIMTALFAKVVSVSVELLNKSRETIEETEAFNEEYHKIAARESRTTVSGTIELSVDMAKTDPKNNAKPDSFSLPKGTLQVYTDDETGLKRYTFHVEVEKPESEKD